MSSLLSPIRLWLWPRSQSFFFRNSDLLLVHRPILSHGSRVYSSSSSKRNPPTRQKQQEVPFVKPSNISERELAHRTFFALHRPLLTLGSEQLQANWDRGQGFSWEEEEEIEETEEELSTQPQNSLSSRLSLSTQSTFHPPTPASTPFSSNSSSSVDPIEAERIVNRFFSELESKVREGESEWAKALHEQERKAAREELDDGEDGEEDKIQKGGVYFTNIKQKKRLKMNKHKHKKLRKRQRALRKKLGK